MGEERKKQRNWNERQGENEKKEEDESRESPRETIGLDKERERELCRESLINWLFI